MPRSPLTGTPSASGSKQIPLPTTPSSVYQDSFGNAAMGLDEELLVDDQEASREAKRERKRLGRPRTRDKEHKRNRTATDGTEHGGGNGAGLGVPFGRYGATADEVPLALDTNFDQIDDFVDTSVRQPYLVGPMDERLSPEGPFLPRSPTSHTSPILQHPTARSTPRDRSGSGSVTFADRYKSPALNSDVAIAKRPLMSRFESGPAASQPFPQTHEPIKANQTQDINQLAGLRKLTRAEAQTFLAQSQPRQNTPPIRPRHSASETSTSSSQQPRSTLKELQRPAYPDSFAASEGVNDAIEDRKASNASLNSQVTTGSGISPTTSLSKLTRTDRADTPSGLFSLGSGWNPDVGTGIIDRSYKFPSSHKASEVPRKSSASSGKIASSWMAPDSWAVQPSNMRDVLRDEDDDENERKDSDDVHPEPQSPAFSYHAPQRALSSASGVGTNGGRNGGTSSNSASADAFGPVTYDPTISSILSGRRGTQDSITSGSSNGYADSLKGPNDDSNVEVLSSAMPTAQPPVPHSSILSSSHARPSSKGGTIGGAAAAAAGKLGLHRPSRMKHNSRPNTAGSIGGGTAGASKSQINVTTPTAESESIASWKTSKRPNTGTAQGIKMTFVRIYRNDNTHTVVSIPLTATAAELRSILARKSMDTTAKRLFVRDKGSERPLGESEKPAILQRRRLEQAGYTEADGLDELGREDLSYLLKFVYRPDSVTKFESNAFGDIETDFNRLDLQNQNLEMVPIFLYRHADWIQSLDLSGNPMSDIPLDFVQLCSNLSTLRLSHLALKRIPQSIRQAVKLTHLDISDNRIPELSHVALDEIPRLMSLKVQNNRLFELPSYFATMRTLRDLNISNNRFEVFPSVACQIPSLIQLDISFNTIASLPTELGNLVNLQRLVLVGNMLVKLPESIGNLVNLRTIDLRRNLLQEVSEVFALPKLQALQCEHNSIKNLNATFGVHLKTLEIGHNPLSKAVFVAQDVCALTSLNLSSANMGKLDEEVLSRLPNLTHLVLDKNTLVVLPDNLGDLSQLRKLSCSNNLLATLPDSLGHLSKLEELQVHNNNLKSLPTSLWLCGKLHTINVSSNLLESFPEPSINTVSFLEATGTNSDTSASTYGASHLIESRKGSASSLGTVPGPTSTLSSKQAHLPLSLCLTRLRLGDNRLTEDIFDVLGHLNNLQVLNLSCNEIYELPNYGLSKHVNLVELYLSGNSLSSIPADVLPLLQELQILYLNGNKLQNLPAELGKVKKLVKVDVGNNSLKYNISNQQYDWNWNSNPNLRYLNLSGNKRLEIKSNPVLLGSADHRSGWKRTDSSDFQRLSNLRLLGLMDVTVTLHQMPDQFEDRRVRTSLSQINQMAYGISDSLGKHDHLSIIDVVIPRFRKMDNECMFGLFAGRGHGNKDGSRIAFHLAEWVQFRIQWEVQKLQPSSHLHSPESDQVVDILRRAFLRMEKEYADVLISEGPRKRKESKFSTHKDDRKADAAAIAESQQAANWKSGASAVLAYIVNRTLFITNVGDSLAVLSRNSQALLVSTKHEPFDRNETLRIRSAEGWVSLHGQVNDKLDVSRSFGHYHLAPIVNAAPAVTQVDLTDSDEFVILANRTLWDVIPYQTAVDIARMERDDPMTAAQKLRDFAISYGAEDSIMVMVVAVGDLFEKSRTSARNGSAPYNAGVYPFGMLSEPNSAAYEADSFKKVTPRRAREDRDLPGDRTLARLQREVAPPIGHVAVVFTDIKNSTSLWETNGGMQSAMRLHNFLLRRQLRNIGGYEVKTEGDAFMVSFQNVTSALLWCFQVQLHLLKENWPQELLESEDGKEVFDEETGELLHRGLSVRMGLHWGWPVCEADPITRRMDYFGPMVNRASRISGAADGGQILASRDVVNELRAIMGTFDDDKKRGLVEDEGAEYLNGLDEGLAGNDEEEEAYRLMHPNVSRDVILLRRMGFAISDIGERRLKGLETPEFLNLVYPKSLTRRHAKTLQLLEDSHRATSTKVAEEQNQQAIDKSEGIATAHEVFEPTVQLINIEDIRLLGYLCLRLEALAQGSVFKGIEDVVDGGLGRPKSAEVRALMGSANKGIQAPSSSSTRIMVVENFINRHPELSMYAVRDDATDQELHTILKQLTGRVWIALSSLSLRKAMADRGGGDSMGLGMDLMALVDLLNQPR